MNVVISSTYSSLYFWYIPITAWCWNRFGVNVICFIPNNVVGKNKYSLIEQVLSENGSLCDIYNFDCPEHKEATYSQCSRLYAAALDLPENETLVVSDADMLVLNTHYFLPTADGIIDIYGADLVPPKQYPMCYLLGTVSTWRKLIGEGTVQQHLDKLLQHEQSITFRGDFWGRDQETAWKLINENDEVDYRLHNRAKPGTQFATHRLDRDDSFILDRLSPDIWDYHANRPGYEPQNFEKIMAILNYYFPHEDLSWIEEYNEKFKQLL